MSVVLTGTAGWATRVGRCAYLANQVDDFRGDQTEAQVSAIYAQFASNEQLAVGNLYANRDAYRQAHAQWLTAIRQVAHDATVQQVHRDDALPSQSIDVALAQLIQQFKDDSETILRPTVAATAVANGANVGDAVLRASVVDPTDGAKLDYVLAETINVTCTTDVGGGASAYQEACSVEGDPSRDAMAYNWPGGSGVRTSINAINGEGTHLVTDGGFESWTGAVPDEWTTIVGAATIAKGASPFRGSGCLQITSDGATLTRLRSEVLSTLKPLTAYALNVWAKISATAAGTLVIKLVDGSGNTINDEAGTANELSIDTSSDLTTSFAAYGAFFRLPREMPDAIYLDIHLTAAPTSGRVISVDTLALVQPTQLYTGGPLVALFSGATKIVRQDRWTLTVTNSHTTSNLSRSLDRFFDLRTRSLKFPSATSSETVPDSVIAQG